MLFYDETQEVLYNHISKTKEAFNDLLNKKYGFGDVRIVVGLDLGFPHDVIRIAGGFATGAFVYWKCNYPVVPVDTCVNDCAVTFFEVDRDVSFVFEEEYLREFKNRMNNTIYKLNFHRGNHFIVFARSINTGKLFLILHSSANEFKDNYNGLYPTETNYIHECIRVHEYSDRYIRYVDGKAAELFWHISEQLPAFNEARHEFIVSTLLNHNASILNAVTSHHYCMPTANSVIMGGHVTEPGMQLPFLTLPGENIFLIQYNNFKDRDLGLPFEGKFLTPHGLGKCDSKRPEIRLDYHSKRFSLDDIVYDIKWGESLRSHSNLSLRKYDKEKVFRYLDDTYDYKITDEFFQIASINKLGPQIWNSVVI